MNGTFEFQNAMHGRWKDTGYRNANGLLSAVHWNFPALTCVRGARAVRKIVKQLEDSGLRRSVRIFYSQLLHYCMATCRDDTHKSTQACFHSFSHGCMEIYAIYFEALWSKQKGVPAALLSQKVINPSRSFL